MTPVLFDVIIIGLLLLSAALGFMRGFCNEVFTIFGWIGAVIATIYFTPVARDYGRQFIENKWLADLATASVIFLGTLLVFSLVSYFATKTLQASKLNFIDRSLGFGFGVLRGIVLLGLSFYLFAMVFSDPAQRPAFVQNARTRPFLETAATWVQVLLPKDMKNENIKGGVDALDAVMTPISDKMETLKEEADAKAEALKKEKEQPTEAPQDAPIKQAPTQEKTKDVPIFR